MNNQQRIEKMQQLLTQTFSPTSLEIKDDSHLHIGHAGAKDGKGHFTIIIGAETLQQCALLNAHQLICQALDQMMQTDIHALSIHIKKGGSNTETQRALI